MAETGLWCRQIIFFIHRAPHQHLGPQFTNRWDCTATQNKSHQPKQCGPVFNLCLCLYLRHSLGLWRESWAQMGGMGRRRLGQENMCGFMELLGRYLLSPPHSCGWQYNGSLADVHILIPGLCEFVTLCDEKDFADVMNPGLSGWCNLISQIFEKGGRRVGQETRREKVLISHCSLCRRSRGPWAKKCRWPLEVVTVLSTQP